VRVAVAAITDDRFTSVDPDERGEPVPVHYELIWLEYNDLHRLGALNCHVSEQSVGHRSDAVQGIPNDGRCVV
jgi:hypothetical protein